MAKGLDPLAVIGCVTGTTALLIKAFELWYDWRPRLRLVSPIVFRGTQSSSKGLFVFFRIRIANLSKRPAVIYFETLTTELLIDGKWISVPHAKVAKNAELKFDLDQKEQERVGLPYTSFYNPFDSDSITNDHPYTRYLPLQPSVEIEPHQIEEIRLKFTDCAGRNYCVSASVRGKDLVKV